MTKLFEKISCAAAIVVCPSAANGDDSTAALRAGGIEFTKTAHVRMAAEDLRISPDAVRIRYEFANDSDRNIDTLVAFPLPNIDTWNFYEEPLGRTTKDPVNFVGFTAKADGKPVAVKVEQRAFYNGRDVTALLRDAGVPVNVILNDGYKVLNALPEGSKKKLERAGIAERDAPDQEHPKWLVRTRFYWMQHFPAHKTVVIEHDYQPVTGQAFFTESDANADPASENGYLKKTYCMDAGTLAALKSKMAGRKHPGDAEAMLTAYSIDFILKTANNWNGGIGRFHLTVDKGKPGNVLSLCWGGDLRKTGPATFEFRAADFHPSHDIRFIVIE